VVSRDWNTKIRNEDGCLALEHAGELTEDEIRAWLRDYFEHGDPG